MEGSEDNSLPKPHTDECEHPLELQKELGLGFQPSPSADPDPNLDPPPSPPPTVDVDQQATNEEHQNQRIVNQELQTQQPINEELQNQQPINEGLQNQQPINEGLQNQQTYREELLNQLQNLVLKEKEKLSEKNPDREEDVEGAGNEANETGTDLKVDVGGEDRHENDDAKGEEGFGDGNDNDYDNRSENENEVDNGIENVREGTAMVAGLNDGRYGGGTYHYPVRPDAEDCSYYLRTGTCKFGSNCKFNHPPRRTNQAAKEKEDNSERPGPTECKYYLRSGGCKFGKACRYNHSRGITPVAPIVEFNFLGLPIRPGEKECPYYMRNGSCKYGSNCRFNHPDPTTMGGADALSGYGNGGSVSLQGAPHSTMSSWSSPRALNETGPFVPLMLSPTQGVPSPNTEWNGYQAPVYPAPERSLPTPPAFALSNLAETNFYTYHKQPMLVEEFPERPGQPECSYFLKTGDCKYRSGCKFHHPKNRIPKTAACALSDKGLPLRPDQNVCSHYSRYGICKFGPACKFDHPVHYGQSASSAASGTDEPSPLGNLATSDGARMYGSENGREALIQQPV